jgi:hypothetical protein
VETSAGFRSVVCSSRLRRAEQSELHFISLPWRCRYRRAGNKYSRRLAAAQAKAGLQKRVMTPTQTFALRYYGLYSP